MKLRSPSAWSLYIQLGEKMSEQIQELASTVEELTKDDFEALFSDTPLVITDSEVKD